MSERECTCRGMDEAPGCNHGYDLPVSTGHIHEWVDIPRLMHQGAGLEVCVKCNEVREDQP